MGKLKLKCRYCKKEVVILGRILCTDRSFQNKALCLACGKSSSFNSDFNELFKNVKHIKSLAQRNIRWTEDKARKYKIVKKKLIKLYGRQCANCKSDYRLQIDHIFPKFFGGKNVMNNYQLLCNPCNSVKRDCWKVYIPYNKKYWTNFLKDLLSRYKK